MSGDLGRTVVLFDLYETIIDVWTDEDDPSVWEKLARFLCYRGLSVDPSALHDSYVTLARRSLAESPEEYPEVDVLGILRAILVEGGYSGPDKLYVETAQLFRVLSIRRFELFADALPTLRALRPQFRLGLVSNAQRVFLEPEIRITGLLPFFEVVVVSSDYRFHKPDRRMFSIAIDQLGVGAKETVYVGDSLARDISGAQALGMGTIWLNRNYAHDAGHESVRPDRVIASLQELCNGSLL